MSHCQRSLPGILKTSEFGDVSVDSAVLNYAHHFPIVSVQEFDSVSVTVWRHFQVVFDEQTGSAFVNALLHFEVVFDEPAGSAFVNALLRFLVAFLRLFSFSFSLVAVPYESAFAPVSIADFSVVYWNFFLVVPSPCFRTAIPVVPLYLAQTKNCKKMSYNAHSVEFLRSFFTTLVNKFIKLLTVAMLAVER